MARPGRALLRLLWQWAGGVAAERGATLPLTIVLLTTGTLVVVPLLSYMVPLFAGYRMQRDVTLKRATGEAGIYRVIADLRRGADGIATSYSVDQPHNPGDPYQTFAVSTNYSPVSVSLNGYTATVTVASPTVATAPPATQQYVDPGTSNPDFATVDAGNAYLVRLFQVGSGTLQINWDYTPKGQSRIAVYHGFPVNPATGQPFPAGKNVAWAWPADPTVLDTGDTLPSAGNNDTYPIAVSPGVYTIVFLNSDKQLTTTAAFSPSGNATGTWLYVKAYRDYAVTANVQGLTVSAFVRQIPGYTQEPEGAWSASDVAWIDNAVYIYSWNPPR